ncbi:MAG: acyl carrier protein [Pseudomonadota bacterium]
MPPRMNGPNRFSKFDGVKMELKTDVTRITHDYVAWLSGILEETVSEDENFLDVGGNSMIAITLNGKLKKAHGFEIDLHTLFTMSVEDAIRTAADAT